MTTNAHTPGPWWVIDQVVYAPNSGTIAEVSDEMIGWRENAALISAAPELLEALEELFSAKADQYGQPIPAWVWKKASAALAKARGIR